MSHWDLQTWCIYIKHVFDCNRNIAVCMKYWCILEKIYELECHVSLSCLGLTSVGRLLLVSALVKCTIFSTAWLFCSRKIPADWRKCLMNFFQFSSFSSVCIQMLAEQVIKPQWGSMLRYFMTIMLLAAVFITCSISEAISLCIRQCMSNSTLICVEAVSLFFWNMSVLSCHPLSWVVSIICNAHSFTEDWRLVKVVIFLNCGYNNTAQHYLKLSMNVSHFSRISQIKTSAWRLAIFTDFLCFPQSFHVNYWNSTLN